MKKKLVNSKAYPASCVYCEHGRISPGGISVLCVKKGIVKADGKCRRFAYDPLKREPQVSPAAPKADASEFEF